MGRNAHYLRQLERSSSQNLHLAALSFPQAFSPRRCRLRERWPHLMLWIFALNKVELVLLIASAALLVISLLLLLEIGGIELVDWL